MSKQISDDIKQFSYEICQKHKVIIRYMETDKDHIHYMIETEPTMSISKIVNLMKSYTTYHIWKRYPYYLRKHFWREHTFWEVKAKLHRNFSGQIKSATVSQVSSGKYYVSILAETEHRELVHTTGSIGIDLGIKDLCITSEGKIYENLKIIRKYEKQLVKLQRQLAHKEKRSKNYYKTKKKIALCHEKIRNTRKDYLHKVSHEIISENQVIVSENLQIKNMVKNHHLAKAINDVSWYELTRQLEYKAKWNGRKYIKIDTFYASSQICSVCGYKNSDTKDLSVRTWICPKCGTEHDRDINAAKNILAEGLRQIA